MKKIFMALASALFCLSAIAQNTTGIYGVFESKENKAPISGVEVFLLDTSLQVLYTITSNEQGQWGFDINKAGLYAIQYSFNGNKSQILTDIEVGTKEPAVYKMILSTTAKPSDNNPMAPRNIITAKEIEKMPQTNNPNSVSNRAGFYNDNGVIKSAASGTAPSYFIDGQRVLGNPAMLPGTVDHIQISTR
jgi:hypothetical protein